MTRRSTARARRRWRLRWQDPDLSLCAYYRRGEPGQDPHGICSFGCETEPACITCTPPGGWPRVRRMVARGALS